MKKRSKKRTVSKRLVKRMVMTRDSNNHGFYRLFHENRKPKVWSVGDPEKPYKYRGGTFLMCCHAFNRAMGRRFLKPMECTPVRITIEKVIKR